MRPQKRDLNYCNLISYTSVKYVYYKFFIVKWRRCLMYIIISRETVPAERTQVKLEKDENFNQI